MKDPNTEGYIGITERNVEDRLGEHIKRHDQIDENCILQVLHENTEEIISNMEALYRPESHIGWNKSPGGLTGGRPTGIHTSGWTQTEESKTERSKAHTGEGNPFYGRTLTDEHKKAIGEGARKAHKGKPKNYKVYRHVMRGKDNPKSRAIFADGVAYDTITECQKAYGFKYHSIISYRVNSSKWPLWFDQP